MLAADERDLAILIDEVGRDDSLSLNHPVWSYFIKCRPEPKSPSAPPLLTMMDF